MENKPQGHEYLKTQGREKGNQGGQEWKEEASLLGAGPSSPASLLPADRRVNRSGTLSKQEPGDSVSVCVCSEPVQH